MRQLKSITLLLALFLVTSCTESHFITDNTYRKQVQEDYAAKIEALQLTAPFNEAALTTAEQEAMQFLYAYMPLGDVTDYDSDFYLQNVRSSFEAKAAMPWGVLRRIH